MLLIVSDPVGLTENVMSPLHGARVPVLHCDVRPENALVVQEYLPAGSGILRYPVAELPVTWRLTTTTEAVVPKPSSIGKVTFE